MAAELDWSGYLPTTVQMLRSGLVATGIAVLFINWVDHNDASRREDFLRLAARIAAARWSRRA